MSEGSPAVSLRSKALFLQALPIIAANAAVPLLGLVDTAVIGHFGSLNELAALAMASLIFSFVYWCFGFLRMGTTGFVARAQGAEDMHGAMRVIVQSVLFALVISIFLLALQKGILWVFIYALAAPAEAAQAVQEYFHIRVWGAPATLITYVFTGVLIGLGDGRRVLSLQLFLNGANALLDMAFAGVLGLGVRGIALGTVLAEYTTLLFALFMISGRFSWADYLSSFRLSQGFVGVSDLLSQNRDIFIRTFFLLLGFAFFTRTSANFGALTLAANHVLLQFISFAAFFLDGYAYVLESHTGRAAGKKHRNYFDRVLKKLSLLSFVSALALSLLLLLGSPFWLNLLTDKMVVITHAQQFIPFVSVYIVLSVGAYQLDGAFIGAGYGSAMRNCAILSMLALLVSWFFVFQGFCEKGLWMAFIFYVLVRAVSLYFYLPRLRARCF